MRIKGSIQHFKDVIKSKTPEEGQKVKWLKHWDNNNKKMEIGLDESMYNSNNT